MKKSQWGNVTIREFASWIVQTYLINIIIPSRDTGALWISQPWIFLRTIGPASLHVSRISNVVLFEGERTLDSISAGLRCVDCCLSAVPSFECAQLFQFLRICHPLECLSCCDEVHIGTVGWCWNWKYIYLIDSLKCVSLLTVLRSNPKTCEVPALILWFGTNWCGRPSCMALCSVRNVCWSLLESIRELRRDRDYAERTRYMTKLNFVSASSPVWYQNWFHLTWSRYGQIPPSYDST